MPVVLTKFFLGKRYMVMQDIRVVSHYVLNRYEVDHQKLQKLCYYAQSWYLANYGKPLMTNQFEAWVNGPVSPDLYMLYKDWGWVNLPMTTGCTPLDEHERILIENVLNVYGLYTTDELVQITQKEFPWIRARNGISPLKYSRNPISMKDMRDYYGRRIGKHYI